MKTFGKRLRENRKKKKLTMKEFGRHFNLAESTISGYENGTRKPDIELVEKFADFLEVSTDYLLGRENQMIAEEHALYREWDQLSEEDKQKALEHIKFLRHLAEQKKNNE